MRSILCPHWEARPAFQNKAVKERVHSLLSTVDAYRKKNPPQCSTKLQCRSGWRKKSPEGISTPGIFHSVGELSPSKTPGALLYCQLCYSTYTHTPPAAREGSSPIVLQAFCYSHQAITTQHSCSHWFHCFTTITLLCKRKSIQQGECIV